LWAGFADARRLRVGKKPAVDPTLIKRFKQWNKLNTLTGGCRPIFSGLGQTPESYYPFIVHAGKEDPDILGRVSSVCSLGSVYQLMNNGQQRTFKGKDTVITMPLIGDGGMVLDVLRLPKHMNICPYCGTDKSIWIKLHCKAEERARQGKPMLLGWPVMSWSDHPFAVWTINPPPQLASKIPELFMLMWGANHSIAHLVSEYAAAGFEVLLSHDPKHAACWQDQIRKAVSKWKSPLDSEGTFQLEWKSVKELLDVGLPKSPIRVGRYVYDSSQQTTTWYDDLFRPLTWALQDFVDFWRHCGHGEREPALKFKAKAELLNDLYLSAFSDGEGRCPHYTISCHVALVELFRFWHVFGLYTPLLDSEESGEASHRDGRDIWNHSTQTVANPRREGTQNGWTDYLRGHCLRWAFWISGLMHVDWGGRLKKKLVQTTRRLEQMYQ